MFKKTWISIGIPWSRKINSVLSHGIVQFHPYGGEKLISSADREHQGIFPVTGEENTIILGVIAEIIAEERIMPDRFEGRTNCWTIVGNYFRKPKLMIFPTVLRNNNFQISVFRDNSYRIRSTAIINRDGAKAHRYENNHSLKWILHYCKSSRQLDLIYLIFNYFERKPPTLFSFIYGKRQLD